MYKKFVLKNGLPVIEVPMPGTEAVTVLILAKVGSRYENQKINGISHFCEHLFFKGTKKRPTTLSLSKELDKVGAEYNAFTSKNVTGFYIKINYDNLKIALDILSDMLINSLFKADEIEREKKVILEEINMYEDNPLMYVEDIFEQIVFKNNPLGWKISGEKKNIEDMTRRQILDFIKKHYFAKNMMISVAGKTNHHLREMLEKYFVNPKLSSSKSKTIFKPFKQFQAKPQATVLFKETEQVQLALGFPGIKYTSKDLETLNLLNIILGGNMSSRLFINVRERRGLAYFIKSGINTYEDTGTFMIQAGLGKDRINDAIKVILEELKKISTKGISATELQNAKQFIKGKLILNLEDSLHLAEWYAKQSIYTDKLKTPEQKFGKLSKVTAEQVQNVAQKLFKQSKLNLALIGPFKEEKKFESLLKL